VDLPPPEHPEITTNRSKSKAPLRNGDRCVYRWKSEPTQCERRTIQDIRFKTKALIELRFFDANF
jgi:hypothetical protein